MLMTGLDETGLTGSVAAPTVALIGAFACPGAVSS